ncbi:MAG: lysophospholipid acyltransferase family protein [Bryobacteraceae bacterium]
MSPGLLRAFFITNPLIIAMTAVLGPLVLAVSLFFDPAGRKQIAIAQVWSRWVLKLAGVKMHAEGLEKIDRRGSYVFVSNHRSLLDTPAIQGHIPVQFRFLAKTSLFRVPLFGIHMKRAGHIAVSRENPRAAMRTMSEAGRTIRERGISVLLFPEGNRSPAGLRPFKEGAALIAIKAGVPVVPLCVIGTHEVLPKGSFNIRPGKVTMRVGDPIPTAHLKAQDRAWLTQQLHDEVEALLGVTAYTQTK